MSHYREHPIEADYPGVNLGKPTDRAIERIEAIQKVLHD